MNKILIIDDDRDMCLLLNRFLTRKNFEVSEVYTGKKAMEYLENNNAPDLILSDFRLEDMDGSVLLKKIKAKYPSIPVIIITGYSDIKTAVTIMKSGAFDYIVKPLLPDEILATIQKALASQDGTSTENDFDKPVLKTTNQKQSDNSEHIFGNTASFRRLLHQITLVAPTNYSVIIYGESGSGKEVIAQEIHKHSKRAHMPFIAIDCGALSRELAGSELFGHEKGSFTGAVGQKVGSFELANGGTIFLDEIANLSYDIQVALLRVTQERKMRRVGGLKDIDLDVRIIIASNENLWDKARAGKFREDLYHRFNEFCIEVPPLRDRKEDIMTFANHFLNQANRELEKDVKGFSKEVEDIFHRYVWHGNLRELKNVIKRATLLTEGQYIEARYLPFEISNYKKLQFESNGDSAHEPVMDVPVYSESRRSDSMPEPTNLKAAAIDKEYELIVETLKKCNYNKSKAAKVLNIDRKTIYNKLKQYQQLNHH